MNNSYEKWNELWILQCVWSLANYMQITGCAEVSVDKQNWSYMIHVDVCVQNLKIVQMPCYNAK